MHTFQPIRYERLNSRQKENFNFQKVAAQLADFGFNCLRLSDDWQGADFIACHVDGNTFLKVQLKGRLNVNRKYCGKDIYIAFCYFGTWYVYPDDALLNELLAEGMLAGSRSWDIDGEYHWGVLAKQLLRLLDKYMIRAQDNGLEAVRKPTG
jgi:hypothetical protein